MGASASDKEHEGLELGSDIVTSASWPLVLFTILKSLIFVQITIFTIFAKCCKDVSRRV